MTFGTGTAGTAPETGVGSFDLIGTRPAAGSGPLRP
jgi:hypothetical protein